MSYNIYMPLKSKINPDSVIAASKEQISCDLKGEAVILNQKDSVYYGLNEVGASIWNLIQKPKKISEIVDAICEEYDVEKTICKKDILKILEELDEKELIEVRNGAAG